jgi:hypothetical protein
MHSTFEAARRLDGYADAWLDQSINPASGSNDEDDADLMNDPEKSIINVAVTTDTTSAEAKLRRLWGGALCVSLAQHTESDLQAVMEQLLGTPDLLSASAGRDHVNLEVIYDDGFLQEALDQQYGADLVMVSSALRPYPG